MCRGTGGGGRGVCSGGLLYCGSGSGRSLPGGRRGATSLPRPLAALQTASQGHAHAAAADWSVAGGVVTGCEGLWV